MASERRLIDASACPCIKCDRLGSCRPGLCEVFAEWWLSPVDAVEVVRCKDCKHTEDMMPIENGKGCMMGDCTLRKEDDICVMVWGDDFCSYGERRSDD